MALHGVISNLLSLGAKLLPAVTASAAQAPSSSSTPPAETHQIESGVETLMKVLKRKKATLHDAEGREISDESVELFFKEAAASSSSPPAENHQIRADLESLMRMLKRIKATLYDAEQRELRDQSVKLWLRELKGVAYDAEDVLDEYHYEVLRAQVEAREAAPPNSHKRKQVQMPNGMFGQIKQIKGRFDEICKDRIALQLSEEDGPRRHNSELQRVPTSHLVVESNIFGREREKEELIDLLSSEYHDGNVVSVVAIVGTGGLGKTTLAQLTYNDKRIRQRFGKCGWVCISEDFNVEKLTRELVESITKRDCHLTNLSALQNKISEVIQGQRVLLVLDDVWNEKRNLWELFQVPLMSAKLVKILVTTRNEPVAQMMQAVPIFNLGYLLEEQCWRLFQHYAFGEVNQNEGSKLVKIGKQIMKKCGMLPLAVKAIASLLRYEAEEESWREILENELWESNASNEIFPPLQISYARLPTYLKPCFLYCSIFPKDYLYRVEELVRLWICQGYIESKEKNSEEKIGQKYAKQLRERSLCESVNGVDSSVFKLHDMVHDLARFYSENGCYSNEVDKIPDIPKEPYHLYVQGDVELVEPLSSGMFTALRTLIVHNWVENSFSSFDFSKAQKLRALELKCGRHGLASLSSVVNLKHLRYLSLDLLRRGQLECICSLYSLQILILRRCLIDLPKSIGNLVSLKELVIERCSELRTLPNDMESLTNLQTLKIFGNSRISSLPPSLSKLAGIETFLVMLECETMGFLKDLVDLKGTLFLGGLNHVHCFTDVQCANLLSMHNLEGLELHWMEIGSIKSGLKLDIKSHEKAIYSYTDEPNDFLLMVRLQPHRNLKNLHIVGYGGETFPKWIENPTSCASLERIVLEACKNLTFLPFGSLCKLNFLGIYRCSSLRFLRAEFVPLKLQVLEIRHCRDLISVPGIKKLKFLVELCIIDCENLHSLLMDAEQTMRTKESFYQNPLLGLRSLTSLRILQIKWCPKLQFSEDELLPVETCKVEVSGCPGLKEWCLQHSFTYKE